MRSRGDSLEPTTTVQAHRPPLVSVVISNFNGAAYLRRCLSSLIAMDYPAVEVVVVDAGSTDDSVELIRVEFPDVRLVDRETMGVGAALNIGIAASRGELLLLDFNSDEVAKSSFLRTLVSTLLSSDWIGAVGGTRILEGSDETVDSLGGRVLPFGYFPRRGQGLRYSEISREPDEVDYLGHFLVRRQLLDEIGGFDEKFYLFGEDTDFSIRIRKQGYTILQVPSAVTYHVVSGTVGGATPRFVYFNERARMRLVLKHCPAVWLPLGVVWTALVQSLYLLVQVPICRSFLARTSLSRFAQRGTSAHLRASLNAVHWNIVHLRETLALRGSAKPSTGPQH